MGDSRNRPEIRLNPVPAGFPASKSGSGSGPVLKRFAGFQPEIEKFQNFLKFKISEKNLKNFGKNRIFYKLAGPSSLDWSKWLGLVQAAWTGHVTLII